MALLDTFTSFDMKLISIVVVSIGCFASGLAPVYFGLVSTHSDSLVMSSALCFGGGILLSTSLVHILPETQRGLPDLSSLIFCLGFLLIYLVDISFLAVNASLQARARRNPPLRVENQVYGAINEADTDVDSRSSTSSEDLPTNCTKFNLLLAFSIHSLLEGIVIGVEKTAHGVLLLLAAICSHKIVVAFCLGAELVSEGNRMHQLIPPLSLFIVGSDLGIALGAFIDPNSYEDWSVYISVLQGLAGGTLLYVVVMEILPRERSKFNHPTASFIQFGFMCLGFGVMSILSSFS